MLRQSEEKIKRHGFLARSNRLSAMSEPVVSREAGLLLFTFRCYSIFFDIFKASYDETSEIELTFCLLKMPYEMEEMEPLAIEGFSFPLFKREDDPEFWLMVNTYKTLKCRFIWFRMLGDTKNGAIIR